MLKHIYVKDFILFDEIAVDFHPEFSVFCGETGAGKSLLIDAIAVLLGARVNASYVKSGKEKAIVEGVFETDHPKIRSLMEECGLAFEEQLIITREISMEGKSIARINHRQITASLLKQIGMYLVDIHSQHDSQYLLNSKYHLSLLDQFIDVEDDLKQVKKAFAFYQTQKRKLDEAMNVSTEEEDLDYLQFQLSELNDVCMDEEEYDALIAEEKHWMSFEKVSSRLQNALSQLEGNHMTSIYDGCKALDGIDSEVIQAIQSTLYDGYYQIEEAVSSLHRYFESMEYDEARFHAVQEQLFSIHKVMRKHGGNIASMHAHRMELQERIDQIANREEYIKQQEQLVKQSLDAFYEKANILSSKRKDAAKQLEAAILSQLHDLYLEHARFEIVFEEAMNETGIDAVSFHVSMNPGAPLAPLSKVASGGELSRFMLGMKTIFTKLAGIETVIFDEIDTGVSGRVALTIGDKMKKIAARSQVLAVTHLAQVAAHADIQYEVEKQSDDVSTKTVLKELSKEDRIEALGYMATGSINESSIQAASDLYHSIHHN